ncbi:uncharacterized protein LOC120703371 [Panicum virgatum]|nr:uncharacterized protein LOC120703371 [Panicum virgatum]KAG2611307.1 hypothetical protein PVAP13_4KG127900 [Panicum virgatum]KAG2611308.1 hypothetical protein PVAP13_4KG127900 [Panicum virgatum]
MSFWAPFVLVHLGGQETITAFSKQDNELYRRHLLNLVTQVAVAGYVVGKASWPDARLRAAVAIVFFSGCTKYAERIWFLYFASPGRLRRWSRGRRIFLQNLVKRRHRQPDEELNDKPAAEGTREEAVKKARDSLSLMSKGGSGRQLFWDAITQLVADIMSVDAPLNQTHNITIIAADQQKDSNLKELDLLPGMLKEFLYSESRHSAYEHVGALLGLCYRRLYTKDFLQENFIISSNKISLTIGNVAWSLFTCVLISIALALFMAAEKGGQLHASSRADIWVSYLLLVGAIVLDVSSVAVFSFSRIANCNNKLPNWCKKQWSQKIGQYSIIKSAGMWSVQRWISWDVTRQPITKDHLSIHKFILDTLLVSGTKEQWNIASTRGQLALRKWTTLKALEETVRSSFDFPTSVLIWHIATDICYYSDQGLKEHNLLREEKTKKHKQMSRELSQYVMYLVFKCGVMLTTNSELVHDKAEEEIADILLYCRKHDLGEKDAVMRLFQGKEKQQLDYSKDEIRNKQHEESEEKQDTDEIQMEREESPNIPSGSSSNHMKKLEQSVQALESPVLPRARAVAQELISIKDEAERWDLIAAVWAEKLYYTAARCGGGFHYEHLSTGGEFATHVLVLMYLLGPFLPLAYQ